MKRSRLRKSLLLGCTALALLGVTFVAGCVRKSGETWYIASAPLPQGWPELTPIDQVEIRTYPVVRSARVTEEAVGSGQSPMFNTLFRHISSNDIAMTAPVDMGYATPASADDDPRMTSMAFLYRTTELGELGADGDVAIVDDASQTFASVGVRGGYTDRNFERGLARLVAWLDEQSDWRPNGDPRYLGYNGPFTPSFWRYGEVQVPVVPAE